MNNTKEYIDHEVRIQIMEKMAERIESALINLDAKLDAKLDNQFKWTVGIMISTFAGLIVTKLI